MRTSQSRAASSLGWLAAGAAAGAAGTAALDAVTYLDMVVRGRAPSSTPEQTVERLSELLGVPVPGEGQARRNRVQALGALLGISAGVGTGAALGMAHALGWRPALLMDVVVAAAAAAAAGNVPMVALGVTDPRQWTATDWVSDVLPHLAYGGVAAVVLRRLAGV